MKRISCLALAPLALLTACGPSADVDDVTETLRMTEEAQLEAVAAKDVDGVMRLYEEDAVVIVPNTAPVTGAPAIRSWFEKMVADPNLTIETTPGASWIASAGDLAVTTYSARFTLTDPDTGERRTVPMSNQTVWTKDAGSSWKIATDYNVLLPEEGEQQVAAAL